MATNEETYDQPLAMTTTNIFEVNHEDAYDSDVDEGPNAAVAFMANLSSISATNSQVNEVHSNDNQIFDNVDYQLSQEMHQEEHLDSDAETEIDDNTIPYHQYLLDTEAQNVPTEVSADTSDKVSMIAILTDLQTQLDGHAKEQALVIQRNKRNAELVQENDLLKSTLSGKEKSIAFLQSEKEKILSEKKDLADSYLDEIVCLKNANKVARDMLQRFNMPTQTIPMLSKKPIKATDDLHKDILGTRNPGLGYMAKRAQPVLYDADTLLHPTHHPVSIWDSEEVLVHQVVSMKKMNEKPGHVRPKNGFYEKLNALMFVPQKDLSGDQAYWLSANEIASQASKSATPATPFVRKSRPPSQVLASLRKVNAVFPQLEGIIKERTTQKPDYVSDWCFDYAKQFVEQQLVPFYDHFKNHIQTANDTFFKEIREFEQIFDELEAEYEQCVLDNKNLTIEKKNLLIINECLIAECLEKDICSIVLTSDIVVPPSSLKGSCDQQAFETDRIQLKDTITSLRIQLDGLKVEHVSLQRRYDELSKVNTHSRTAYTEKLSAFPAENTKLKAPTWTVQPSKALKELQDEIPVLMSNQGIRMNAHAGIRTGPTSERGDFHKWESRLLMVLEGTSCLCRGKPVKTVLEESIDPQLDPEKLAHSANVPTSRDARVSLPIAKESTVTPASKSLELSTNVAPASSGTSHVLDDVAEVTMVGSERASSGLTNVVVALFAGENGDGSLPSSAVDEEADANP
ncbi:hypothetical protein Tco_0481886 [Tanacetum coccineum]